MECYFYTNRINKNGQAHKYGGGLLSFHTQKHEESQAPLAFIARVAGGYINDNASIPQRAY